MTVFYNDNDSYVCKWLVNLAATGHLPMGAVCATPIQDLNPDELASYDHAHFFAGIGGWPLALRLAGWPDEWPVWTGSCPCQPFSAAGKGLGAADPRHLWPAWFALIRQRHPEHVFGEQVASAIGHGWLDGVFADLEEEGYTCGAVVLGAHSVGAPHIRQRVYWMAVAKGKQVGRARQPRQIPDGGLDQPPTVGREVRPSLQAGHDREGLGERCAVGFWSAYDLLPCLDGKSRRVEPGTFPLAHGVPARVGRLRAYGNAIVPQTAALFVRAYLNTLNP